MSSLYPGIILGGIARMVDDAVATIAPKWGRNRLVARAERLAILAYDAAKQDRTRRNRPMVESADDDLLRDLPKMRSDSRTMVRDDSNAASIMQVMRENVVGTGILPQSIVKPGPETGFSKDQAKAWNRMAERYYRRWAKRYADATGHATDAGLQLEALEALLRDGEFLFHRVAKEGRAIETAIEFVDVDRLLDPPGKQERDTRSGVTVDKWGAAVGYWITPRHPSERFRPGLSPEQKRNLPVFWQRNEGDLPSIVHGFVRRRAGQRRGVPMFSSNFALVEALNDIVASEAVANRQLSKIVMAITQAKPLGVPPGMEKRDDGQWIQKSEMGVTLRLRQGEQIQAFNPNRPGNNWDAFVSRALRSICSAWGMPYELVARDFAKMNYASARIALTEARRTFEMWQQVLINTYCQVCWDCVITEGVLTGALELPPLWTVDRDAYLEVRWVPPSWGYVDPTIEIEGSRRAVESNLSTQQHEAARNGMDLEQVLDAKVDYLVMAKEKAEAAGLEPDELLRERAERIESVQTEKTDGEEQPVDGGEKRDDVEDNEGEQAEEQPESNSPDDA